MSQSPTKQPKADERDPARPRAQARRGGAQPARGAKREGASESEERQRWRLRVAQAAIWIGVSLVCGLVLYPPTRAPVHVYEVGEIAESNLKAPTDLAIEDHLSTAQRRSEAMQSVLPIYDYDEDAARLLSGQVGAFFNAGRKTWRPVWELEDQLAERRQRGGTAKPTAAELKARLEEARKLAVEAAPDPLRVFNKEIDKNVVEALRKARYSAEIEVRIQRALEQLMRPGVIGAMADLPLDPQAEILLRRVPSNSEAVVNDPARFYDLDAARKQVERVVKEWFADWPRGASHVPVAAQLTRELLRTNLAKNIQATEARREVAAAQVKPVYLNLKAGEVFAREGERINEEDVVILSALAKGQHQLRRWVKFFGVSAVAGLCLALLLLFAMQHLRRLPTETKDLQFYAILLALVLGITKLVPEPWQWGGYVAYGAVLIRLLLPAEAAFFFAAVASIFTGFLTSADQLYTAYALVSGIVGILLASQYQHRLAVVRTGLAIGLLNVIGYWTDLYLHHEQLYPGDWKVVALLVGVGLVGLVAFVYPLSLLAERLFNYTSAIRLMELNDPGHPLVKEVFFKTPGTYQHSLVIGTISEAAAKAIDADALLLRVAAFYHDIGKTKMPQYFIENMPDGGKNSPHNKLSPNMSAIIIAAHVKDGIEMARAAGLPERVIDMIPQHHGTKLMKYFWGKAQEQWAEDQPPLREEDFRYPGPKPQSREAGIMLLADASEAAVRTLPEFTEARIRGAVQKIINDSFSDGQLSECDLTLKDLNEIAKAFTRTLAAFHHHRIKYPEPAEKYRKKAPADGDSAQKAPAKPQSATGTAPEAREENLKRLGS